MAPAFAAEDLGPYPLQATVFLAGYSFLSAEIEGGQAETLFPKLPQPVAGRFTLVGKLTGPRATDCEKSPSRSAALGTVETASYVLRLRVPE